MSFFVALAIAPIASAQSCEQLTTAKFSWSEFQRKINRAYHELESPKARLAISLRYRISPLYPFKVIEQTEFFPNGELPSIAKLNEVRVISASREAGIRELRKSVNMSEERGWFFLPSMKLWIYNSVVRADARHIHGNALLGKILERLYGGFESYHNHPNVGSHLNYQEYLMANIGLSFEQYHPMIALPTTTDLLTLMTFIDLRKKESLSSVTGYVVSEFGLTSYRVRAFPYNSGERDTGIYPAATAWSHLEVLKEDLPPNLAIRKMLLLAEETSTQEVSCMEDICQWTPETAPKTFFEFTPW